ncbi:unnamed protein product [Prorocentrum cordatum]|uniref:Uncharacterized protein n=1 Tax=Prorocentrum cordatum TaxID=2364126 RepID=A0ABN9VRZ9_9DINO|nr:unnamed protein product [Polarella glacialis]
MRSGRWRLVLPLATALLPAAAVAAGAPLRRPRPLLLQDDASRQNVSQLLIDCEHEVHDLRQLLQACQDSSRGSTAASICPRVDVPVEATEQSTQSLTFIHEQPSQFGRSPAREDNLTAQEARYAAALGGAEGAEHFVAARGAADALQAEVAQRRAQLAQVEHELEALSAQLLDAASAARRLAARASLLHAGARRSLRSAARASWQGRDWIDDVFADRMVRGGGGGRIGRGRGITVRHGVALASVATLSEAAKLTLLLQAGVAGAGARERAAARAAPQANVTEMEGHRPAFGNRAWLLQGVAAEILARFGRATLAARSRSLRTRGKRPATELATLNSVKSWLACGAEDCVDVDSGEQFGPQQADEKQLEESTTDDKYSMKGGTAAHGQHPVTNELENQLKAALHEVAVLTAKLGEGIGAAQAWKDQQVRAAAACSVEVHQVEEMRADKDGATHMGEPLKRFVEKQVMENMAEGEVEAEVDAFPEEAKDYALRLPQAVEDSHEAQRVEDQVAMDQAFELAESRVTQCREHGVEFGPIVAPVRWKRARIVKIVAEASRLASRVATRSVITAGAESAAGIAEQQLAILGSQLAAAEGRRDRLRERLQALSEAVAS